MVNRCFVEYGRRAVRVICSEFHGEFEDEVCVGCVGGAVNGCCPFGHVFVVGEGGYAGRWLGHDVHELFLQAGVWPVRGHVVAMRSGGSTYRWATVALAPFPRPLEERAMVLELGRTRGGRFGCCCSSLEGRCCAQWGTS